jgi:hypothetical protein|tara:strand:+ start:364 stop:1803 length:1440 start_codon:yes stop_codon:yes gene_type:complete
MIRNYYLENYKSGKSVTPSDTLLIDGSTKIITSTTNATNLAMTAATNLAQPGRITLKTQNLIVQRNMQVTGAAGGIPVSGQTNYPLIVNKADITTTATSSSNNNLANGTALVLGAGNTAIRPGMTVTGGGIVSTFSDDNLAAAATTTIALNTTGNTYSNATALPTTSNGAGTGMTITITVAAVGAGIVTGVIVASGSGYAEGDIVTVVQGGAANGTFVILSATGLALGSAPVIAVAIGDQVVTNLGVLATIATIISTTRFTLSANVIIPTHTFINFEKPLVGAGITVTAVNGAGTAITLSANSTIAASTSLTYAGVGYEFDLSSSILLAADTALTYTEYNQSSWKPYNVMIGQAPSTFTIQNNVANTASVSLVLNTPDNRIKTDMNIGGVGVTTNGTKITNVAVDGNNVMTITLDNAVTVAANASLTYSFTALNTIKVLTIDNEELTITNPLENQILPLSVVQVFATGTLQITNITALN